MNLNANVVSIIIISISILLIYILFFFTNRSISNSTKSLRRDTGRNLIGRFDDIVRVNSSFNSTEKGSSDKNATIGPIDNVESCGQRRVPTILLVMISNDDVDDLVKSSASWWLNVCKTPIYKRSVVPVIIRLCCDDVSSSSPPYSYCKHGKHDGCLLYDELSKLCTKTGRLDYLQSSMCIHCPVENFDASSTFDEQKLRQTYKGISYAMRHMSETGQNFDRILVIPITSTLSFGWDLLYEENYNQLRTKSANNDIGLVEKRAILCSPVDNSESAIEDLATHRTKLVAVLRAQANRNGVVCGDEYEISGNTKRVEKNMTRGRRTFNSRSMSNKRVTDVINVLVDDFDNETCTEDDDFLHYVASILCNCSSNDKNKIEPDLLLRIIYDDCRHGNFTVLYPDFGGEISTLPSELKFAEKARPSVRLETRRMSIVSNGNDSSPTLSPWFGEIFYCSSTCLRIINGNIFDKMDSKKSDMDMISMSLLLYTEGFLLFNPLRSFSIDHCPLDESYVEAIYYLEDSVLKLNDLNRRQIAERFGIRIELDNSFKNVINAVSADCRLGIFKSIFEDHVSDSTSNDSVSDAVLFKRFSENENSHSIICRYGSWGNYMSKKQA